MMVLMGGGGGGGVACVKQNTILNPLCILPTAHIIDCAVSEETKSSQPRIHLKNDRARNQAKIPLLAQL